MRVDGRNLRTDIVASMVCAAGWMIALFQVLFLVDNVQMHYKTPEHPILI